MSDADHTNDVDAPCAKKLKISQDNGNGVSENQIELKDFIPEQILNNNSSRKTVSIRGKFKGKSGVALILLEKNAFKEDDLNNSGYFSADTQLKNFFQNDIYGNYECFPKTSLNGQSPSIYT
jgi:m7GpppX diphosphatase